MKKKTITLTITLVFALILSACSGSELNTLNNTTSPDSTTTPVEISSPVPVQYKIGNTIRFGGYEWLILDVRYEKALLLTKEIIALRYGNISDKAEEALTTLVNETIPSWGLSDFEGYSAVLFPGDKNYKKYDGIYETFVEYDSAHPEIFNDDMWHSSWENCSLREWLNSEMDFTPDEWDMIETTEIIDKTGLGANTSDKVFLLDKDDVEKYFPRNESRGASCGANVSDEELLRYLQDMIVLGNLTGFDAEKVLNFQSFYWWVRGSSAEDSYLEPMSTDDDLFNTGHSVDRLLGVRPAIWIKIGE